MDRQETIEFAQHLAKKYSRDPSTKVGAVVLNPTGMIQSYSWNRFHKNVPNYVWGQRELKYKFVIHAEEGALLLAGPAAIGGTIITTHHPCRQCAKLIAAAGIKKVVCPAEPWRDDPAIRESISDATDIFKICDVEVEHY